MRSHDLSHDNAQRGAPGMSVPRYELPLLGSNQDSPDPESRPLSAGVGQHALTPVSVGCALTAGDGLGRSAPTSFPDRSHDTDAASVFGSEAGCARDARSTSDDELRSAQHETARALGAPIANESGPNPARTVSSYRSSFVARENAGGAIPHVALIAELPLDELTVKALARALGLSAHAVHDRYARASAGRVKLHLDREWLGRVSARIVTGERLVAIGYDAASSTQGFARKVKRLTGLTPAALRRALAIDPALLTTPSTCSTPGACAEGGCAGRCWRVGA